MTDQTLGPAPGQRSPQQQRSMAVALVGAIGVTVIILIGLSWAKWLPYAEKIEGLFSTREWDGASMFAGTGAPSLDAAWEFATAYTEAVWKALLASLLIAAAIDALVSRRWLVRMLSRGGDWSRSGVGAALGMPSMMCTCCTAPITVTLRRSGAPLAGIVSHWLANPLLNPAVLVFMFLVAPWEWGVTRFVVGATVVVGAGVLASVVARRAGITAPAAEVVADDEPAPQLSDLPGRYVRSLWRISRVLIPEYAVVVLVVGAFSGWLARFTELTGTAGLMALLAAAAVGIVLVIPTGGEIPVLIGLSALGASAGLMGVLLITLPALSLPSMVMVAKDLSIKVTAVAAATVAAGGFAAALLLTALT